MLTLTLQVTVNWFQMQQMQTVSLPPHYQAQCDTAKLYEPGECYAEFVRNLPKNLPKERLHSDSMSSDNTRYPRLWLWNCYAKHEMSISKVRLKPLSFVKVLWNLLATPWYDRL